MREIYDHTDHSLRTDVGAYPTLSIKIKVIESTLEGLSKINPDLTRFGDLLVPGTILTLDYPMFYLTKSYSSGGGIKVPTVVVKAEMVDGKNKERRLRGGEVSRFLSRIIKFEKL